MNYKELVESLKSMLPPKVLYGDLIGAEGVYAHSGPLVYEDPEPYFIEQAANAITDLLARAEAAEARAENAERKLDAAILELDEVSAAVDNLDEFIDEQIHPLVSYDMYTELRDNADYISIWRHEVKWRGKVENVT